MRSICVLCTALLSTALAEPPAPPPHVDLVIAIDVSGSMRGLLDATRAKLWDVVRLLGRAQPQPQIRVGLITYGGKYYDPASGWVRRELDLTGDLDAVSQRLFALSVRGSEEYVARAVQTGVRQMSWDQDPRALKILFVAGNESAEQDPRVTLASALGEARQRGIHVNAIYCGRSEAHDALAWRRVAALGGGEFAAAPDLVGHNASPLASTTPYDAELGRLSRALSNTSVAYGVGGAAKQANQRAQDEGAASGGEQVAASRADFKASGAYDNSDWDAVDALAKNKKAPAGTSESELRNKMAERAELQRRIRDLSGKRDAYLSPPVAAAAPPPATTTAARPTATAARPLAKPAHHSSAAREVDDAFVGTVRKQAESSGFGF
jgi:hypothetical protein